MQVLTLFISKRFESRTNYYKQSRSIMDFIFRLLCALTVSVSLQSTVSAASRRTEDSSNVWEKRIRTSLNLLQRRPCWGLSEQAECHDRAIFSNPDTQKMRLYTAAGPKKVRVVLPDRKQRRLAHHSSRNNSYDAVFVIDPFPEASFGHLVFLFLVSYDVNETTCNKTLNGAYIFTDRSECIRRAEKFHCRNRVTTRKVKCEINFIPMVYYKDDSVKARRLRCRQKLINLRFATCPALENFPTRCSDNKPRCDNRGISKPDRYCSHKRCNHAVLVSGGWNSFASRQRYRRSLHNVWALLHSTMRYRKQFIRTFLGQGQKRELAKDQIEKTYVVDRTTKVRQYISNLCRSILCVETLTLYLTGPANSDGALMFWDRNQVGITDESKLYTPKQLLDDIRNCSARRVFLIADYSYSGAMINRLKSRISRHPDQFRNIMAISSTDWGEYAGRNNFTDVFIEKNKEGPMTKSVIQVFKDVKRDLRGSLSTPQIVTASSSSFINITLDGYESNKSREAAKDFHPCKLIPRKDLPSSLP